jgi:hypothetical protein
MLAYYHMKNPILLLCYDQTIFEGVIALIYIEYFIKKFVHTNPPTY